MLGFGFGMGVVFPFYANAFVEWKEGLFIYFALGCVGAGVTIGIFNDFLVRRMLVAELKKISLVSKALSEGDLRQKTGIVSDDAVGEIANMIAGGAKATLSQHGHSFKIAIPSIVVGKNHTIEHKGTGPCLVVPFELDSEIFWIEVSFQGAVEPG